MSCVGVTRYIAEEVYEEILLSFMTFRRYIDDVVLFLMKFRHILGYNTVLVEIKTKH